MVVIFLALYVHTQLEYDWIFSRKKQTVFSYISSSKELIVNDLTLKLCVCEYTDLNA